jgi:hypothetical protein
VRRASPGSAAAPSGHRPEPSEAVEPSGLRWNTRTLLGRPAERPFARLDDDTTDVDRTWAELPSPKPPAPRRLRHGLTAADFAGRDAWLWAE